MRSSLTGRAEALGRKAWLSLVLLILAGPLLTLTVLGTTRLSWSLLIHLGRTVLPMQLGYSVVVAAGAALTAWMLSVGGLSCALFDFPGRRILQRVLLLPLLVPAWFLAVLYREIVGLQGAFGLILVSAVYSAPLFHLFGSAAIRSVARKYPEVLRVAGRNQPATLVRVLLPLSFPALGAAAAVTALLAWSDAAAARTMAVPTLTVGLLDQWFGREEASVGAVLGLLFAALSVVFGWMLWWLVGRLTFHDSARLSGPPAERSLLRGVAAFAPWVLSAPQLAAGVVIPTVMIGKWSADRIDKVNLASLGQDTFHTLLLAASGTVFAALLALPIVHAQETTRPSRWMAIAAKAPFVLFALPPAVLAAAMLLMFASQGDSPVTAFVQASALPVVAAFALRYAAVFVVSAKAALLRHARDHVAVLRLGGHTDALSFVTLLRPFLARPVSAAAAFVFLGSLQDILLPLTLQPFGFNTLSTSVFQYAQTQRVRDCAVWMLCLALIGIYPLFTLARLTDIGSHDEAS